MSMKSSSSSLLRLAPAVYSSDSRTFRPAWLDFRDVGSVPVEDTSHQATHLKRHPVIA
jgi:hypothetical protein